MKVVTFEQCSNNEIVISCIMEMDVEMGIVKTRITPFVSTEQGK